MVTCPVCEGQIDVDEEDVDEGDSISCDECGADLRVVSTDPLEIESAEELEEDDEDVGGKRLRAAIAGGVRFRRDGRRPATPHRAHHEPTGDPPSGVGQDRSARRGRGLDCRRAHPAAGAPAHRGCARGQ